MGLVFHKDGMKVMQELIGASNHGHLAGLALLFFFHRSLGYIFSSVLLLI